MNKQEIRIVPVQEKHIPECVCIALKAGEILHASFKNRLGAELDEKLHTDWRKTEEAAVRGALSGDAFVALLGDKVVGYTAYAIKGMIGVIGENAVDPACQSEGVYEKLYEAALEIFRISGCKYANAKTSLDESNAPALEALKKVGFELNLPYTRYYMEL